MTMTPAEPTDLDLRAPFEALRRRDLAAAPEFDTVLARAAARATPSRRSAAPRAAWALALTVAVAAIAVWLVPGPMPMTSAPDSLALPGWRTPTDSLLADANDPLHGPSWTAVPTAALGQPFFHPVPEIRR